MSEGTGGEHPRADIGDGSFLQTRGFKIGLLVASGLGLLVLAGILRDVTTPILIALIIAYVLDPVVLMLERLRIRRMVGVCLVYVAFLGVIVLIIATLVPGIYREIIKLPGYVEQVSQSIGLVQTKPAVEEQAELEALAEALGIPTEEQAPAAEPGEEPAAAPEEPVAPAASPPQDEPADEAEGWLDTAQEMARQNLDKIAVKVLAFFKAAIVQIAGSVGQIVGAVTQIVLVFIYTFFFLLGLHPGMAKINGYLPGRYRDQILKVTGKLDQAYSNFFRGRSIICLCSGVLTSAGLWMCSIPFWLLIGMTVGVLGIIPFVGVMVGLIPALLLGVLIGGWKTMIGVLVVFAVVQSIEPLLTPLVLSRGVKLHPVTILIGLLVGAELFGVFGAVIAVPLASTAKILAEEFLLPPLRELADEEPAPPHG